MNSDYFKSTKIIMPKYVNIISFSIDKLFIDRNMYDV